MASRRIGVTALKRPAVTALILAQARQYMNITRAKIGWLRAMFPTAAQKPG
jgi:hypothetical protein